MTRRAPVALFGAVLIFGLVLRLLLMRTSWRILESDEATGMVLAIRASHGHLTLLFPGQDYGGVLTAWVEAPLLAVFGVHLWVYWAVDTASVLIGAFAFWGLAKRLLPPVAAACVGAALWIYPPAWIFWSAREYEFWDLVIALAIVCAWLVVRWSEHPDWKTAALAGLSAGAAVWCHPLVLAILLPVVAVFAWNARRHIAHLGWVVAGGLVGVSPWLAYFVIHGSAAVRPNDDQQHWSTTFDQAVAHALPAALSIRTAPAKLGATIYVAAAVLLIVLIVRRRVGLAAAAAGVLLWPVGLLVARVPVSAPAYRYAFVLLPGLILLAGYLASMLRLTVPLVGLACGFGFVTASIHTNSFALSPPCQPGVMQVGAYLKAHQVHDVWASYWIASDLTMCEYPDVTAGVVYGKADAETQRAAATARPSTYVVFANQALDAEITAWVAQNHLPVSRTTLDGYAIWSFDTVIQPRTMHLLGDF